MTPARMQQIQDLYMEALDRAPEERNIFLSHACQGDADLRNQIESLLAQNGSAPHALQRPAFSLLAKVLDSEVTAGSSFGPYRIESLLGEGGMGRVYKARDTRLDRTVALKVSKTEFSRAFDREARTVAALNHPNICTLHDVGPNYLVMELVEGPTLADRIKRGPIPLDEALPIAKQIADALEAAHEKGIVHRDLKPGNIKIRPDGSVKVLDFGLAKSAAQSEVTPDSPTRLSMSGMILGTAGYMSPEQARGDPVDKRADIWAFGVVLYEMVTGDRLFQGKSTTEILAAVIKEEPDLSRAPARTRALLARCLEKNPKKRLRDIGDAMGWLEASEQPPPAIPSSPRLARMGWTAATAVTALLAVLAFIHFREKPPVAHPMRLQLQLPENLRLWPLVSLSPDGRKLAFLAQDGDSTPRLWVHFLESGESRNLADAGGTPFWSPDSRFIAYPWNALMKIDPTGGPPQTIADFPPGTPGWGGGAWNQEGVIVYGAKYIYRVPASGGVPVQITSLDPTRHETVQWGPAFLPDGRHFLYTSISTDAAKNAIFLGSIDAKREPQNTTPLLASRWLAEYAPSADPKTGYLLFVQENTLLARPFDNHRLELKGEAVPVAEQTVDGRAYTVSANGVLVFQRTAEAAVLEQVQPTWYDRAGNVAGTVAEPGKYSSPMLSPDGKRLAVTKGTGLSTTDIWLFDLPGSDAGTRFTFGSGSTSHSIPVWSPDGNRLALASNSGGPLNLYQKPANGLKEETALRRSSQIEYPTSWSPDGRFLLYEFFDQKTKGDIWVLPMEGNRKPVPFQTTEAAEGGARFSPDGHYVAYMSDESGRNEIYVRSFSMNSAGTAVEAGGKWQISNRGGGMPIWRGDSRELFYRTLNDGRGMAVEIATGPAFRAGNPQPLGIPFHGWDLNGWDVTRDGKRFLVMAQQTSKPGPYTIILNWQAALKK